MSTMEHPNVAAVRAMFAAFRSADLASIMATVPENLTWHFPGRRGLIAGTHRGQAAVLDFLGRVVALTDGTFGLDIIDIVGSDEHVVALFRGHGRRGDRTLDNPTCLKIRFNDGQPVEIHEFVWDLFAVDDFWS
jgi:ketosteroid isomerase-like protein